MATSDETDCDLSKKKLSAIPNDVQPEYRVSGCRSEIPVRRAIVIHSSLRQFKQVGKLTKSSPRISTSDETVGNLSRKYLRAIPEKVQMKCSDIRSLDHSYNPSIQLHNYLRQFSQLRKLVLTGCELSVIPDEIGELTEIETLKLNGNDFPGGIPPIIWRLVRLKQLHVAACKLTTVPQNIGELEQLENLRLRGNDLSGGLPADFGKLRRLKKLDLQDCHLTTLPESICNLEQLEQLELSRNNFTNGLPADIGKLVRLKALDLADCHIATLPESIGNLQQLETLSLTSNNFSGGVPTIIWRWVRLKLLCLEMCKVTTLPKNIGDLEQLEDLRLEVNDLSGGLPADIGKLRRLKELNLQDCNLTTVPESLCNLEQLETLILLNNKLQEYPKCTLLMKSLRSFDLSNDRKGNWIKQLPIELVHTSLKQLELSNNPITEPPEAIWTQGIKAIKSYMRALIPGGSLLHADTLNMIGDTGAGKTSLAQSLVARSPRITDEADRTQVLQQFSMKIDEHAGLSVNINDFGGHDIYHSVIPIFLPVNGLAILVFNLNDEQRKEHIKKWLLTAVAKSSEIRVIIVGAHADEVGERRSDLEIQLLAFVAECLESACCEVSAHINHLNHRSDGAHTNKFEKLHQVRKNLQNALADFSQSVIDEVKKRISLVTGRPDKGPCNLDYLQQLLAGLKNNVEKNTLPTSVQNNVVRFLTLSCLVATDGLDELHKLVVNLLHPPENLPIHWCRVIVDMLKQSADYLYLTMKQVENICRVYFSASDDSEALKTILRYLAKTSQIIWLENHAQLCDYIFHSPQRIIDTCKKMLYHDIQTLSHLKECYKSELESYDKGILLAPLLKQLLSTNVERHNRSDEQAHPESQLSQSANVVLHFMEQFNLMSRVRSESGSQEYIVPCNLSSAAPSDKLKKVERIGTKCLNRVIVRLSFIGSVIPMSLFETTFSMILSVAGNVSRYRSRPYVWRDGVIMIYDGVYFIAKRRDSVITLVAFSTPGSPSPWTILHPVLKTLSDNVQASWHGAPPHCVVVCPGCARRALLDDQVSKKGEIPEDLTRLALTYQRGQVRPMCDEFCCTIIPQSLCYATEATGSFTNDHSDVEEFFRNVERMHGEASTNETSIERKSLAKSELFKNLRSASDYIASHLTDGEVTKILQKLHSADCVIALDKEDVEGESGPTRRANKLLDILEKKSASVIRTFEQTLRAIKRRDLADRLISGKPDRH